MSKNIRQLLDDTADAPRLTPLDLAGIERAGQARLRRRLRTRLAGAGVAVALAGISYPVLQDVGAPDELTGKPTTTVSPDDPARLPMSWASGELIHYEGRTLDVGTSISSFVPTPEGFVLSDRDGGIYRARTTDGSVEKIGQADLDAQLVAGSGYVGWAGLRHREAPVFTFYSLESKSYGQVRVVASNDGTAEHDSPRLAWLYGIDNGTAYLKDGRGLLAVYLGDGQDLLGNGEIVVLEDEPAEGLEVDGAVGDQLLFSNGTELTIGTTPADARPTLSRGELPEEWEYSGLLSPGGSHYAVDDVHSVAVVGLTTESDESPDISDLDGFAYFHPVMWLDRDTLMVATYLEDDGSAFMTTCSITAGTCRQPTRADASGLIWPNRGGM
jgi:hypothetical protein